MRTISLLDVVKTVPITYNKKFYGAFKFVINIS